MAASVEKLDAPFSALMTAAVLGLLSTTTGVLWRWARRPTVMVMSEDWMSDRARTEAKQGGN
jgi:hypothetical protein